MKLKRFISSTPHEDLWNMKVRDLFIPGLREWDTELLSMIFEENEVKEILSIHINSSSVEDKLIRHFSKNGAYSVRSAYALACSLTIDTSNTVHGNWKLLWKLRIPPKVKVFLWRAARDCLPTKENLMKRRMQVGGESSICKQGYENNWHVFIGCPFAWGCWRAAGFESQINQLVARSEGFKELVFNLLNCDGIDFREGTTMLLWQIWRERNAVIWEGKHPDPHRAHLQAKIIRHEWQHINVVTPTISSIAGVQRTCRGWHNLHEGWMQCGVDVAFFAYMNATGVGIILRDAYGNFIFARVLRLPGCLRVEEGEAMGLCEALSWAKNLTLNNVEFVIDSKLVVDAIADKKQDLSEFGAIIEGCRSLLESNRSFKVKHVYRDANIPAHHLAKLAKDFSFPHVWNEPPPTVEGSP